MILTSDELPKTDGLVSDAVIFFVDGIRYAGHYHSNGWFYCDEWRKGKVGMAKGPHATASTFDSGRLPDHKATAWEYVRSNVEFSGQAADLSPRSSAGTQGYASGGGEE